MIRSKLRDSYYKESCGQYWKTMNTTATPTIEYVKWLENIILDNGFKDEEAFDAYVKYVDLTIEESKRWDALYLIRSEHFNLLSKDKQDALRDLEDLAEGSR